MVGYRVLYYFEELFGTVHTSDGEFVEELDCVGG